MGDSVQRLQLESAKVTVGAKGYNASSWAEAVCTNCSDGGTPAQGSPGCPFQRGRPASLNHPMVQMIAIAQSQNGPWTQHRAGAEGRDGGKASGPMKILGGGATNCMLSAAMTCSFVRSETTVRRSVVFSNTLPKAVTNLARMLSISRVLDFLYA